MEFESHYFQNASGMKGPEDEDNASAQERDLDIAEENPHEIAPRCPMCNQQVLALIGQKRGMLNF